MKPSRTAYQSYLLRLWCEDEKGEWRASLENVATNKCHNFPNMVDLFEFLKSQTISLDTNLTINDWAIENANETFTPAFYDYSKEEV
jgi:hypothetical protein